MLLTPGIRMGSNSAEVLLIPGVYLKYFQHANWELSVLGCIITV